MPVKYKKPFSFYRIPLFHRPRPVRLPEKPYVEGSDFDEMRDELRRSREGLEVSWNGSDY